MLAALWAEDRMRALLLAIAGLLRVGCDPRHERRFLPHRILADECKAYFYDYGPELAKHDRRAWVVYACPDGSAGTEIIDNPKWLRTKPAEVPKP